MALYRRAVGIDLGSQNIKVVELRVSELGATVTHALMVERSSILPDGDDSERALARGLRAQLAEAGIPCRGVVLGIGGQDSMIRYTRIPPLPSWRLKGVLDYELAEVAEKIGEPLASGFQVLQLPRDPDEDQTILLGLAKEKPLSALLEAFESEGITVEKAVPVPLAVFAGYDAFGWKPDPDSPEDDLLLLVDMGAENLCLTLVLNGRLAFARSGVFGGKNFTDALAQSLGIEPGEAERVKVSQGGVDERERGVLPEAARTLRSVAGQLFGLLQSSVRFSATQTGAKLPPLTRVALLGGATRLRGLATFIGQGLGKPVEHFKPAGLRLSASLPAAVSRAFGERPGDFGVALGLGMGRLQDGTGADGARPIVTVLPAKYLKRREFWDRSIFLYAAGALLLLLLLVRFVDGCVRSSSLRNTCRELSTALGQLQETQKDLDATKLAVKEKEARLNRLLWETEPTAFQAYVLDRLSRILRAEIQLERIYLSVPEISETETRYDYTLHIAGRVSDEKGQDQASKWIGDLQQALAGERIDSLPAIERVEPSKRGGGWYTFEMSLKPKYVSY